MELASDWWLSSLSDDHHIYLRSLETRLPLYTPGGSSGTNITRSVGALTPRRYIVDWLANVCDGQGLCVATRHLAVALFDYYTEGVGGVVAGGSVEDGEKKRELRLVALACLLIAAKFEEREVSIPKPVDLNVYVLPPLGPFTPADFMAAELRVLTHFRWSVGLPTAAHFVDYFSVCAVGATDRCYDLPIHSVERVRYFVRKYIDYFLEISLQESYYRRFKPSQVCAACVAASRACLHIHAPWTGELQLCTGYDYSALQPLVQNLLSSFEEDDLKQKQAAKAPTQSAVQSENLASSLAANLSGHTADHTAVLSNGHTAIALSSGML